MSDKPDTRIQILSAALEAFAENGYDKTSMDDIVKRSGLSKGSLYWHFKNKHDLLLATIDMVMSEFKQSLDALMSADITATERLHRCFTDSIQAFTSNPAYLRLFVNFFFQSSQSEEARGLMRDTYEVYVTLIANAIQDGIDRGEFRKVDARQAAILMIGAGDGIAFQAVLAPSWDIIETLEQLVAIFLQYLTKELPES